MSWSFESVVARLQSLFASEAAAHFEFLSARRRAERRAELLREADAYESRGLPSVAEDLRRRSERLARPTSEDDDRDPGRPAATLAASAAKRLESPPDPGAGRRAERGGRSRRR